MKKRLISLLLCLVLCFALAVPSFALDSDYTSEELYEKYEALKSLYIMYELDGADASAMLDSAMREILESHPEVFEDVMDAIYKTSHKFSGYYDEDTYEAGFPSISYYGIGVGVNVDATDRIRINAVYSGPAKDAGIMVGDQLIKVDDTDVSYASVEEAGNLIRGKEGSTVRITVYRPSEDKTIVKDVKRGPVKMSDITYRMITEDIAYIYIEGFSDINTFLEFCDVQKDITEKGIKNVIIDVRGNLGGDGDVVLNMLNKMVGEKDVVITNFRTNMGYSDFKSLGNGTPFENLVVLADHTSYSSAEIMAGVIKDLKLGIFVGTTTAGKGIGQEHIPLKDGSVAAITTSEVILPVTGSYHGKGIIPDIRVNNELRKVEAPELTPLEYEGQIKPGDMEESTVIKAVEERLNILGYLTNVPDGKYDLRTQNAVKAYQKAYGMREDGYISATVVNNLNNDVEEFINKPVLYDCQLEAAIQILQ